eukprot:Skav234949  [mRNA]  locus=scaffold2817:97429:99993:- [translate_table: standard]
MLVTACPGLPLPWAQLRQQLLDSACGALRLTLFRMGAAPMELGQASLNLSPLIHDTASLDAWHNQRRAVSQLDQQKHALLSELKTEFDERVAAEAAAKAEAAAAAKAESGEATSGRLGSTQGSPWKRLADAEEDPVEEDPPPQFAAPSAGRLLLKISTAAPMGRVLCPEEGIMGC